jgi:hypothetical protein
MMLPMRISVSVTPAARVGGGAAQIDARNNTAKRAGGSHFILVFINAALERELFRTHDASQRSR